MLIGLIALFPFDPPFFSSLSPLSPSPLFSSLYNSVNLLGCSWLWRVVSALTYGFVFSSVWTEKWKPEARGSTPELWAIIEILTPGNINRWESAQKPLHLYWNQAPPKSQSSSARLPMLILQQNRKIILNINRQAAQSHAKPRDTLKLTTGHCTGLQRDEVQLYPPEYRKKFPHPRNHHKVLVQPNSEGADSTIKRNYNLPVYRKETPNTEN